MASVDLYSATYSDKPIRGAPSERYPETVFKQRKHAGRSPARSNARVIHVGGSWFHRPNTSKHEIWSWPLETEKMHFPIWPMAVRLDLAMVSFVSGWLTSASVICNVYGLIE